MKMAKVVAVVAAVMVATVFSVTGAYAGEGRGNHRDGNGMEKRFDKMAEELNLSAEQKAALAKQREAMAPKMQALKERMSATREQLKAELDKATPDKTKLAALVDQMKEITGEKMQMRIDKVLEMKKVLTPEQSAKMKNAMDAKKKEFEGKWKNRLGKDEPHDDF